MKIWIFLRVLSCILLTVSLLCESDKLTNKLIDWLIDWIVITVVKMLYISVDFTLTVPTVDDQQLIPCRWPEVAYGPTFLVLHFQSNRGLELHVQSCCTYTCRYRKMTDIERDFRRHFLAPMNTVCQKRCHYTFASNFDSCQPIFKILSPIDLKLNFL